MRDHEPTNAFVDLVEPLSRRQFPQHDRIAALAIHAREHTRKTVASVLDLVPDLEAETSAGGDGMVRRDHR
jgi:hypothetical protein